MSDIAIRFDGLALLATLALSGIAYILVALMALIWRRRRAAGLATLMALGTLALTAAFFVIWDRHGTAFTGPDVLDLFVFPWAAVFLVGCWALLRVRDA